MISSNIKIDLPRYDQNTYLGRAKHFFITTNPLNLFKSSAELDEAKELVDNYRNGVFDPTLTEDQLWRAKQIYDSAFHPDTHEKMLIFGRMSFQVPGNMVITGGMLQFYKTWPGVLFWQWINQTFNAVVNYTNRSGDSPISTQRLATSYFLATSGAISTALIINKQVSNLSPLVGRLVPFVAVAAANCVNIPCMRSHEISTGIAVTDENGVHLGNSSKAATKAIVQVTSSRIFMAIPGMTIPPVIMNILEKKGILSKRPWIGLPLQVFLCGLMLTFATPLGCALFPQQSSISFSQLEPELQKSITENSKGAVPQRVYFNKGL